MNCKSGGSGRFQLRMQAQPSSCHRAARQLGMVKKKICQGNKEVQAEKPLQASGSLLTPCSLKALTANLPVLFFPLAKSTEPL